MKASTLSKAIQVCTLARVNLMIEGPPGGGKTTIGHNTVRAMARTLINQCAAQTDPVDVRGVPDTTDGRTTWAIPSIWPTDPNAKTTVFLDEFRKAPMQTMNAYAEAITEGTIGGETVYRFPVDTNFIATGNRRSDRAGENSMPSHLNNRFCHITYETDVDDWVRGSYNNFNDPMPITVTPLPVQTTTDETLIAFIRARPNLLHMFSTTEAAFPTPRSISMVNKLLPYLKVHTDLQLEMITGCVGEGFATEYTGFLRIISEMFDPNLCFTHPNTAPVPENPSVKYALIVALASRVSKKTADPFFLYLKRLPDDFAAVCVQDAMVRDPLLLSCKEGIAWASKNHKLLIGT